VSDHTLEELSRALAAAPEDALVHMRYQRHLACLASSDGLTRFDVQWCYFSESNGPVQSTELPAVLAAQTASVCMKALAIDPQDRYQTAQH
jgi:hypothetical protein